MIRKTFVKDGGGDLVISVWMCLMIVTCAAVTSPCDKSRRIFTESSGIITDGPQGSNYTQVLHAFNNYSLLKCIVDYFFLF